MEIAFKYLQNTEAYWFQHTHFFIFFNILACAINIVTAYELLCLFYVQVTGKTLCQHLISFVSEKSGHSLSALGIDIIRKFEWFYSSIKTLLSKQK